MKKAFSLVELLVALIAISCIIAAFAPVMTKKMKKEIGIIKGKSNVNHKLFLTSTIGGIYSSYNNHYTFTFKVPDGVTKLNAIVVGAGGGGGGGVKGGYETKNIYFSGTSEQTFDITKDMYDFKIVELTGGGGGGGAGYSTSAEGKPKEADCQKYSAYYIPDNFSNPQAGGICVTGENVGDDYGPSITSESGYTQCNKMPSTNCNSSGHYAGCSRTVCQYDVAKTSCENYEPKGKWRLPQMSDMIKFSNSINNLELCSLGDPRESYQICNSISAGNFGPGLDNFSASANELWLYNNNQAPSKGCYQGSYALLTGLNNFSYPDNHCTAGASPQNFKSVRCVLDDISNPSGGGGGSSGTTITNFPININACNNVKKIKYQLGSGGKGASYSSATLASAGNSSWVGVEGTKDSDALGPDMPCVYQVYAGGGAPGANGTISAGGLGGKYASQRTGGAILSYGCHIDYYVTNGRKYSHLSQSDSLSCTLPAESYNGTDGTKISGGWGGSNVATRTFANPDSDNPENSYCAKNNNWSSFPCPGIKTHNNASNAVQSGSGGAGGFNKGDGGKGVAGYGNISYKLSLRGAAGGGGGAGGLIHIRDFPVVPGETCTIIVGKGGAGGNEGNNGGQGGRSKITCSGNILDSGLTAYGTAGKAETASERDSAASNESNHAYSRQGSINYSYSDNTSMTISGVKKTLYDRLNNYYNKSVEEFMNYRPVDVVKVVGSNNSIVVTNNFTRYTKYFNITMGSYHPLSATVEINTWNGIGGYGMPSPMDPDKYFCGGLNQDDNAAIPCSNSSVDGEETPRFRSPDVWTDNYYGSAGAGGAGGGWKSDGNEAGKGSKGQDGYVLLYWENP